jgi:hypothetical protein
MILHPYGRNIHGFNSLLMRIKQLTSGEAEVPPSSLLSPERKQKKREFRTLYVNVNVSASY